MKNLVLSFLLMGMCAMGHAQVAASPYQAVVAADGSGNYKTIQEAVNAAPDGQTEPWLILVKNGSYEEQVRNLKAKRLIGNVRYTILHLRFINMRVPSW